MSDNKIVNLLITASNYRKNGNIDAAQAYEEKARQLSEKANESFADLFHKANNQEAGEYVTNVIRDEYLFIGKPGSVGLRPRAVSSATIVSNVFGARTLLSEDGQYLFVVGTKEQMDKARELIAILNDSYYFAVETARKENADYINKVIKDNYSDSESEDPYAKAYISLVKKHYRFSRKSFTLGFYDSLVRLSQNIANSRRESVKKGLEASADSQDHHNAVAIRNLEIAIEEHVYDMLRGHNKKFKTGNCLDISQHSYQMGEQAGEEVNLSGRKAIC